MIEITLTQLIWFAAFLFLLLVVLFIFYFKSSSSDSFDYQYLKNKSAEIEKMIFDSSESGYILALIEADKLLDYFLKARHFAGKTLGERLKVAGYRLPEIRKVWPAHKMRNRLVHDNNISLTARQARSFWQQYKKAYKILSK